MQKTPPESAKTHRLDGRVRFFFRYANKLGIKLIPKCGSTSVRLHVGMDELPIERALRIYSEMPRRVVVVRNPLDRLRAVYTAFADQYGLKVRKMWDSKYGFRIGDSMDRFLELVLNTPDAERDWHWQSAHHQLEYVRDEVTDYVAIEQYHTYQFMPQMPQQRLNESKPEMKANTPHWSPEQVLAIEQDRPEDFELWERALRNTRT